MAARVFGPISIHRTGIKAALREEYLQFFALGPPA
jgi:hypothetical protein